MTAFERFAGAKRPISPRFRGRARPLVDVALGPTVGLESSREMLQPGHEQSVVRESGATPRVMVVDHDRHLLEAVETILESAFDVELHVDPLAALRSLERRACDVLCADYETPGMSGLELIGRASRMTRPPSAVLTVARERSYYEELLATPGAATTLPLCVVIKPYASEDLVHAVQRAVVFTRMLRAVRSLPGRR